MFKKIKNSVKKLFKQLKDPLNIVIYTIILIIFYCPIWIAPIIKHPAFTVFAVSYVAFWAGPFTPAIPIQLFITITIRKLIDKVCKKKQLPLERQALRRFKHGY